MGHWPIESSNLSLSAKLGLARATVEPFGAKSVTQRAPEARLAPNVASRAGKPCSPEQRIARVGRVCLLGDSIFDNAAYVGSEPAVIEHLRRALPAGWTADLLAMDGASANDVRGQLGRLDGTETHLFVSAGGNDAYNASGIFSERVLTVAEALGLLARAQARFRRDYLDLLKAILAVGKPVAVCTVYDAIPGLGEAQRAGLALFNDVIIRSAAEALIPMIDLRVVCDQAEDYSAVSPIEPSAQGGAKIAQAIADLIRQHDFSVRRGGTSIFTGSTGISKR
jgi:hypothetical protein